MSRCVKFVLGAALSSLVAGVFAQDYPARSIRLVVPFGPGGTTDILGRVIGKGMSDQWGQQVVIDNRPGAGGNIAAELVARAAPDGYTIFLGSMGTQSMNVSLYPKLAFDPAKDFAPVSLVANSANLLLVHPSIPADSVRQLIQLAKARPGKLNYATSGSGSFNHISAELFKMMAGIDMAHIPYKSGGQALTAVLSGEADLIFQTLAAAVPFVTSKKLKALAVCSAQRHPLFPQLPTASESGLPKFEIGTWYGILAPAGTPPPVIARLNEAIVSVLKAPATSKRFIDLGADPVWNTPEQFAALIQADTQKWGKVIKATGARAD